MYSLSLRHQTFSDCKMLAMGIGKVISNYSGLRRALKSFGIGYNPPQNLANYAAYLDSRVKAYRDLKHDAIRVQTESNRDHRVSVLEDDIQPQRGSGVQRSKTIAGRKLRIMSVEKGLLRETKTVQRMIDVLIDTKVNLDMNGGCAIYSPLFYLVLFR